MFSSVIVCFGAAHTVDFQFPVVMVFPECTHPSPPLSTPPPDRHKKSHKTSKKTGSKPKLLHDFGSCCIHRAVALTSQFKIRGQAGRSLTARKREERHERWGTQEHTQDDCTEPAWNCRTARPPSWVEILNASSLQCCTSRPYWALIYIITPRLQTKYWSTFVQGETNHRGYSRHMYK